MNYKNKKKLTAIDKQKIEARYLVKLEEYKLLELDELQELYMNGKDISSTDKQAMVVATNYLMKQKQIEMFKEKELAKLNGKEEEIKG